MLPLRDCRLGGVCLFHACVCMIDASYKQVEQDLVLGNVPAQRLVTKNVVLDNISDCRLQASKHVCLMTASMKACVF